MSNNGIWRDNYEESKTVDQAKKKIMRLQAYADLAEGFYATAIIQLSKEKSEKTRIKVEMTISEMALKKEKINFNSVLKRQMYQNQCFINKMILELG